MPQEPTKLHRWFPIGEWLPQYNWNGFFRYSGILELLRLSGTLDEIGEDHLFATIRTAVDAATHGHPSD